MTRVNVVGGRSSITRCAECLAGYMGSGQSFDDAVGEFAVEYADQNQHDFRAFTQAIRDGRIQVLKED